MSGEGCTNARSILCVSVGLSEESTKSLLVCVAASAPHLPRSKSQMYIRRPQRTQRKRKNAKKSTQHMQREEYAEEANNCSNAAESRVSVCPWIRRGAEEKEDDEEMLEEEEDDEEEEEEVDNCKALKNEFEVEEVLTARAHSM